LRWSDPEGEEEKKERLKQSHERQEQSEIIRKGTGTRQTAGPDRRRPKALTDEVSVSESQEAGERGSERAKKRLGDLVTGRPTIWRFGDLVIWRLGERKSERATKRWS